MRWWGKKPSQILPTAPHYDLQRHKLFVTELWRSYPLRTESACDDHLIRLIGRAFRVRRPWSVAQPLIDCIQALYRMERLYQPFEPFLENRNYLDRNQIRLTQQCIDAADTATLKFLSDFIDRLPSTAFDGNHDLTHEATIPLYDFIPNAKVFPSFVWVAFDSKITQQPVFDELRDVLFANIIRASGYDPETYDGKRKLKYPHEAEGSTPELLHRYLANTPFLELISAPVPFQIPRDRFGAHGIIIAPPEHGKTQLLSTFFHRFLVEGETGIVVLDPHGDLFKSLKDKVPPDRLIILDPSTNPPPLNVFDFGTANEVQILQAFTYLMAALTGGMSDKQSAVIPYLLKLLRSIPGATVATLLELVTERLGRNDVSKFMPHVRKLPDLDRDFFVNQFFGKMQETKDAIAWKLSAALSYDAFRAMFTATTNSFDAFKAMQERKVVLVKGSESVLGEHGLPVFLQFIVAQFFLAALKRDTIPEKDRSLCILFADEASHVFNSQTTRILTECRKYRLGFFAATQLIQQIPQDVKAAIYGATAIKIAGPVSHTDAMLLAREMHTTADDIRALKSKARSHAEWMFYVSNVTDEAIKVSVPFGALDALREYRQPPPIPEPPASPPDPSAPRIERSPKSQPQDEDDDIVW